MPLRYDLSKIKDYKTVCIRADGELEVITETLIKTDVGISRITDMNSEEYFRRLCLLAAVEGAPAIHGDGTPWFITQDDVIAHIGLDTNHTSLSDARFRRAIHEMLDEKAKQLRIQLRVKVVV